jgi:membrane protein
MAIERRIGVVRKFFEIDIWTVKISSLPKAKRWTYQLLRIWIIAFAEFKKDKIVDKASALTFFTLLSIVPVIALAFGIATAFGLERFLVVELERYFTGQETILNNLLEFSKRMLQTADGGIISGISVVFLIYTVLRLMYNIELAFNDIWDTRSRSWQRKIADYIAIALLGPLFVILSSSATIFFQGLVQTLTREIEILSYFKPAMLTLLKVMPFFIISILLMLLYLIFPNTRVKFKPAIIAALFGGLVFQATQYGWINGQVYLSRYNAIYGTFAALPLFMIYLQLSWLIVLFGAEFAYAVQNVNNWEYRYVGMQMSPSHRKKVTLLILRHLVKNFELGNKPLTISNLSLITQIPYRFIKNILRQLEDAGLVNRIYNEESEIYQPAMDIDRIDLFTVLRKLDHVGFDDLKSNEDEIYQEIEKLIEGVEDDIRKSKSNRRLAEL